MLKLKLQYFDHLMWRNDSLEKTLMLRKIESRRGQQKTGWLNHWLDGHALSKLWDMVKEREAWRSAVHGVTKSQTALNYWTATYCTSRLLFSNSRTVYSALPSARHIKQHIHTQSFKLSSPKHTFIKINLKTNSEIKIAVLAWWTYTIPFHGIGLELNGWGIILHPMH